MAEMKMWTLFLVFQSMASSDHSDGPITLEEYMDVKRALAESQARVQQLMQTNKDLKQEIVLLQNMVCWIFVPVVSPHMYLICVAIVGLKIFISLDGFSTS